MIENFKEFVNEQDMRDYAKGNITGGEKIN